MVPARGAIVVLGDVVGSFGVRGWLKVRPFSEAPETLLGYATWWLKPARGGEWREFERFDGRMHSGTVLAGLRGVETREAALALKGCEVGVPRAAMPAAPAGEIFLEDLTGLTVVNRAGVVLGEVRGVAEHGAHPLLRVAPLPAAPGVERLIPYVPAIVDRVDVDAGTIEVDWGEDF
jgi:16S rRNA processing protein RimM